MDTGFDLNKFGQRLSDRRKTLKLKAFDISADTELPIDRIDTLESGKAYPELDEVFKFAAALRTSPTYLLGLTPDPADIRKPVSKPRSPVPENRELELVITSDTGWQTKGFIPPNDEEKDVLRNGLRFRVGPPRELVKFYWDIVPWTLSRLRALKLLKGIDFTKKQD